MEINDRLNELGFEIYKEFKNNTVFRNDIPVPLEILYEPPNAANALYPLIKDPTKYIRLLDSIKNTWRNFLNQNINLGMNEYENALIEKMKHDRLQSAVFTMSEKYKLKTDIDDMNELIGQCSIKHSSIDSLERCMIKASIKKKGPSKKLKKR